MRRGRHREVTGGCLKTHSWVVLLWMLCQVPLLSLKNLTSHHKWKRCAQLDGYTTCGLTLCLDQHSPCPLPLIAGNAQGLPHSRNSRDAAAINPTKQTTQNTRNRHLTRKRRGPLEGKPACLSSYVCFPRSPQYTRSQAVAPQPVVTAISALTTTSPVARLAPAFPRPLHPGLVSSSGWGS